MASNAELLLSVQLEQAGIPFEREFRFAPPRRWRFDFVTWRAGIVYHDGGSEPRNPNRHPHVAAKSLAVEVEGGAFIGGHQRGERADLDCEKSNAAQLAGWTVLRFTPRMVNDGRALAVIRQALGLKQALAATPAAHSQARSDDATGPDYTPGPSELMDLGD